MKSSFKYLACVSAVMLALTGCGKKDNSENAQATADVEVTTPEVSDLPEVMCEDVALKNRVVSLVRDEVLNNAITSLNGASNIDELTQQLKARVAGLDIDLQNISQADIGCTSQLHIVLPSEEITAANKTFKDAGIASIEDQALDSNVSLMGGNRLVADFAFNVLGETLEIDKSSPSIALASETMATAIRTMNIQNKNNAKRETAEIGRDNNDLIPAPTVQIRNAELPSGQEIPTPEMAILRPEDVPTGVQQQKPEPKAVKSKAESRLEPKTDNTSAQKSAKEEPKTEQVEKPKATEKSAETKESSSKETAKKETTSQKTQKTQKASAEPKAEANVSKPETKEITIIETEETY